MLSLFANNSYQLLGLDVSASEKDILKRSKEIINRLKIDDYPEYENDISVFGKLRSEDSIKNALQKLQSPKSKIKEYFFWFNISDEIDKRALRLIQERNYLNAAHVWENAIEIKKNDSILYQKNIAILYCLMLALDDNKAHLEESISMWKQVVEGEAFWDSFNGVYQKNNPQIDHTDILGDFKNNVALYLSDIYTELYQKYNNNIYINSYNKIFSTKSEKMENDIINPIYNSINETLKKIDYINFGNDKSLNIEKLHMIENAIRDLQHDFNKLKKFSLYDDSKTKILRDKSVTSLRDIVLDLHNKFGETKKAAILLEFLSNLAGTSATKLKIEQELETIDNIQKNNTIMKQVIELSNKNEHTKAFKEIEKLQSEYPQDIELNKQLNNYKMMNVTLLAKEEFGKAKEFMNNANFENAINHFAEAGNLIYNNITLYGFNTEGVKNLIEQIKRDLPSFNLQNINKFDEYRQSILEGGKSRIPENSDKMAYVILIDSVLSSEFLKMVVRQKSRKETSNIIGQVIFWIIVIIVIAYFKS